MKSIKTVGLASLILAILLGPQPAVAQAPYQPFLNVTAVGSRVTIQWTPIAGAQGYQIQAGTASGATNIGSIIVPNLDHVRCRRCAAGSVPPSSPCLRRDAPRTVLE